MARILKIPHLVGGMALLLTATPGLLLASPAGNGGEPGAPSVRTASVARSGRDSEASGPRSSRSEREIKAVKALRVSSADQSTESPFVESEPRPVPPFPILLNRAVQQYVGDFLDQPGGLRLAFERSRPFLAEMVGVLKRQGLPDDLVYLAFAESRFSRRGNGPWQFNRGTARRFGLHINRWVDERRDPILSTRAAAEYLATLHDRADNDWRVALVGWNLGEGYLDRYWLLQGSNYNKFERYLPRRTRQLLCRFMAVAFIAHNATAYGIDPVSTSLPPAYEAHHFRGGTLLSAIAQRCRMTVAALRDLNPALLRDRLPPYAARYVVRVPLAARASQEF